MKSWLFLQQIYLPNYAWLMFTLTDGKGWCLGECQMAEGSLTWDWKCPRVNYWVDNLQQDKKKSWWSEYHYSFNSVSTSSLILRNNFLAEIQTVHFNLDNPWEKGSYFLLSPEFQHTIMKRRMFANVNINTCWGIARFPHSTAPISSHWMSHLTPQAP